MPSPVPPETQVCSRLVIGEEWWGPGGFARPQVLLSMCEKVVSMPQPAGSFRLCTRNLSRRRGLYFVIIRALLESNIHSGSLEAIPEVASLDRKAQQNLWQDAFLGSF